MISHPPIPIERLFEHIDMLKASDNMKFSREYESIEPGQQFTWDNSNVEVNKPKNRYANVIAYDHSRVILQPIDGVLGSDYVNSNYMDGYRKQNAYIATQVSSSCLSTVLVMILFDCLVTHTKAYGQRSYICECVLLCTQTHTQIIQGTTLGCCVGHQFF